jgi:hypothetical protein
MRSILLVATAVLFFCVAEISAEERDHGALARNPGPLKGLIHGAYVDVPTGQIHMRMVTPAGDTDKVPFLMLHPSPGSSISYAYLLEEMGTDPTALAVTRPDLVRRIVLIGGPFSPSEKLKKYGRRRSIEDIGSSMSDNFETAVTHKHPDRSLERLYDMLM